MTGIPTTFTSGWIQVGYVILNRDGNQWVTNLFRTRDEAKALMRKRGAWFDQLSIAKAYRITLWKPKHMRWLDRIASVLKFKKTKSANEHVGPVQDNNNSLAGMP